MKRTRWTQNRILALLLAAALAVGMLAGCGGNNGDGSAKEETGRFLEKEIALPEGFSLQTIAKLDDGSLGVGGTTDTTYCLLRSTDLGQTWETVWTMDTDWEEEESYINYSAIAPDSTGYIIRSEWGEETVTETLYQVSPEGEISEQQITLPDGEDGEYNYIAQAACDASGTLFVVDGNYDLLKIDPETGKCLSAYQGDRVSTPYFGIAGETLCAVNKDGVLLAGTQSGEKEETDGALDDVVKNTEYASLAVTTKGVRIPMAFGSGEDDSILFVNHEGIYTHQKGGSVNEQLVDGTLGSISDTSMGFLNIVQLDTENLFVAICDSDVAMRLLHYEYDATISSVPEKVITVYSLTESTMLRQTVTAFQKSNPDTYVKLEVGMTGDDGVTAEDAVKLLNTNILAGNGPDVLILDGLPMDSYVEKGILEDISDIVDEVEQEDGVFTNIRDAYRQDGKQYVMPVRFLFPVIVGDTETVAAGGSLETIADRAEQLAEQGEQANVLPVYNKKKFLVYLMEVNSASWTDGEQINSEKLKEFLKQTKRLYDLDDYSGYDERIEAAGDTGLEEDSVKSGSVDLFQVLAEGPGCGQMGVGTMSGLRYIQLLYSAQQQMDTGFALADNEEALTFVPYLMTGIVSGGDTETAKQFVRMLLDSEISDAWDNGFPTNRASYEANCEEVMNKEEDLGAATYMDGEGNTLEIWYRAMTQEQIDTTTAILESLTQSSMTDRVIRDLIVEQGVSYLDGTQDLDTTVNEIQKKVNLYLSE
ncbi:MAG: extracellular solute-binding protein [Eubacteriales bacterium]|nr:extracellular solute-binding protein [Eubacteriales bacterium]